MVHQLSIVLLALAGSVAFAKSINEAHVSARVTLLLENPVVGSPLLISCEVEEATDVKLTWQFSGSEIVPDNRRMIISSSDDYSLLLVSDATVDDSGEYKCIAQSQNSVSSASVYVNVRHAENDAPIENPELSEEHVSARVHLVTKNPVVGSPMLIRCKVEKPADLKVTWQLSGSELVSSDRRKILTGDDYSMVLIDEANTDDTGEYKCIVQSQNSVASASVYVNVRHAEKDAPIENPELSAAHVSARLTLLLNPVVGSPLLISCKVEEPTDVKLTWQFSGSEIVTGGRRRIMSSSDDYSLLLVSDTTVDDSGEYKCIAHSQNSVAISASVYVNIRPADNDAPMENPELFEGDILGFEIDDDRSAVVEKYRVWPNGRIPYIIDPQLRPQVPKIEAAMQHYAEKTCIRFVPRTDEVQYVKIFPGKGCYSHVGKTLGEQPLSLGAGCFKLGTILHELGHAVGFYHEHSRSDRDDYLDIHRENIREGFESQFTKLRPKQNQLLTPFDYGSVMLYGETVFSKSHYDGLKTMTAKDGRTLQEVNDRTGLSASDIERITKLYKC